MATEESTTVIYESPEEHPRFPRVISGIAVVGLALAGVIGVWTWQAGSDATAPKPQSAEESTIAISTGAASQEHDVVPDNPSSAEPTAQPKAPAYSTSHQASPGSGYYTNVAPLGQDPYLPPNAWNGRQTSNPQPSETIIAEGLNSQNNPQSSAQPQAQAQPQPHTKPGQDSNQGIPHIPPIPPIPEFPRPPEPARSDDQDHSTPTEKPTPGKTDAEVAPSEPSDPDEPQPKPDKHSEPTETPKATGKPTDTTKGPAAEATPPAER